MNRVFYNNNGVLTDLSANLNDYHNYNEVIDDFVAAQDAIYIGNTVPFNHIYFKLSALNVNASLINIAYWTQSGWINASEVIDETKISGTSFARSGFVTWSPTKDDNWIASDTNHVNTNVTGLTAINLYDLYWLKITFSNNLTPSIGLSWVGQKFSDDDTLGSEFPDLVRSSVMTAWEAGKTSWEEQHVVASDIIAKNLSIKGLILEKGQILDRFDLDKASVQKVAEIIYAGMGKDYTDQRAACRAEYESRIYGILPKVDVNLNGRVDISERTQPGHLFR